MVVLRNGVLVGDLQWEAAEAFGKLLIASARVAEETAKAPDIARDQAILLRAGAGFGLTDHRKIQSEAAQLAAWDRDLRRYMPGGVKSQEQFGTPTIVRH